MIQMQELHLLQKLNESFKGFMPWTVSKLFRKREQEDSDAPISLTGARKIAY